MGDQRTRGTDLAGLDLANIDGGSMALLVGAVASLLFGVAAAVAGIAIAALGAAFAAPILLPLVVGSGALVWVLAAGPMEQLETWREVMFAWRLPDAYSELGIGGIIRETAPLAVLCGAVLAMVVAVVWESQRPWWREQRQGMRLWARLTAYRDRRNIGRRPYWFDRPLPISPAWWGRQIRRLTSTVVGAVGMRRLAARITPEPPRAVVPLGVDETGAVITVDIDRLTQHTFVVGATGSGKTTTIERVMHGVASAGHSVVVIDLKADRGLAARMADIAAELDRPFWLWSMRGPTRWNPLARGDAAELTDKLMAMEEWSEPYYERQARRYLHTTIAAMRLVGDTVTFASVGALLEVAALRRLVNDRLDIARDHRQRVLDYLSGLDDGARSAIAGLASRVALFSETEPGQWVSAAGDEAVLDLSDAMDSGAIVCLSLDSLGYAETAAMLGAMAVLDLKSIAGMRLERIESGEQVRPTLVMVDEFSGMGGDHLLALVARARAAGMAALLSTQDVADLTAVSDAFRDQVLGNTATKLVHRQVVPESAETLAAIAGTREAWDETLQVEQGVRRQVLGGLRGGWLGEGTGLGTVRATRHYVVHPDELKQLPDHHCVVMRSHPVSRVDRVRVALPLTRRGAAAARVKPAPTPAEPVDAPRDDLDLLLNTANADPAPAAMQPPAAPDMQMAPPDSPAEAMGSWSGPIATPVAPADPIPVADEDDDDFDDALAQIGGPR